ncbi:MAG: enoyl-CoA hydratase-related protein [Rhizobiaceae bacterium]|nr:enoyl-CoA hydratase-related protein [Rhizobiaceae bacterium]
MSDSLVIRADHGAVATLTINRPKALNALNAAVLGALLDALRAIAIDDSVRAVIITGAGERAFVAGADIGEFVGASPVEALAISDRLKQVAELIEAMSVPVIASVNGFCLGGGMELALACDIRIASSNAMLGQPEIKLGIIPGGGGTVRLVKTAGVSVAKMLCLTGEPVGAERALGLGLVASVHTPEALADAAMELAGKLAALPPFALGQAKASIQRAADIDTAAAVQFEAQAFALCFSTADQKEGATAFLEKRKATFTGE